MSSPPSFSPRSALRRPALLADYARMSLSSRRPSVVPPPWNHADDVLPLDEGLSRLAGMLGRGDPGPAHGRLRTAMREESEEATGMAGNRALGDTVYAVVRALRPAAVVETGVATGVASAFILAALADNGCGALHSIDLPPVAWIRSGSVGSAVPAELKERWSYHWGSSDRLLGPILDATRGLRPRVFLHDSDHSYDNVRWEVRMAWEALAPGDVLLCDDAHFHAGFADAAAALHTTPLWIAQPEQHGVTGIVFR